jgi:hypothetical protein
MAIKKKKGRPSKYSFKLAVEICQQVASGSEGLVKLCALNEHWPVRSVIYLWLFEHEEFSDMYARAKRRQIEVLIDEMIEIADDNSRDTIYRTDHSGNDYEVANNEWINRSRTRIDTRKWLAAKLMPKLYGDKIQSEVSGPDGKPIEVNSSSASERFVARLLEENAKQRAPRSSEGDE